MKIGRTLGLLIITLAFLCASMAGSTGPDDRAVTDPKSVASATNSAARRVPVDDLYYTRSVFGAAWSPDGQQLLFSSDMSGRFNLWKVRASGGWPIQLIQSDDVQSGAIWSPDGKWIVYQQDHAGNELYDLYAIPSDGGEPINLTNTPEVREQDPHWSPDGNTIAFAYKPKEGTTYDIALLDWATRKVHKLTNEQQPGYFWSVVAWSKDGKTIYASRVNPPFTDADVYRINVASGSAENLTPHQGTVRYLASSLSPDGGTLLLSCDAKGGYMNVALLDVATKKISWITDTKWEVYSGNFSPDGKSFTYTMNEDGLADAYLVDRATNGAERLNLPMA